MYITRHIQEVISLSARTFPAVVVTGPRQVGKTTLLQHQFPEAAYTTFDRLDTLEAAKEDPDRFLSILQTPAIIDEVQYVPELFRAVKIAADLKRSKKGRFFLTGSQRYVMMQGVDESMAGRAGTVEMLGLSFREICEDTFRKPFFPTQEYLKSRQNESSKLKVPSVWEVIFRGDLPELYSDSEMNTMRFYDSYIETYLRRDVRDLSHVGDLSKFNRFMFLVALCHGKILNKTDLANKTDVSFATIDRWLSVLEASNIIYMLKPFYANTKKRLVKMPKVYFLNSGLAARLRGFESYSDLENDADAGSFFEGFVVAEIIKSHLNYKGTFPEVYFYRDSNGNEIDLLLLEGIKIFPVEIKSAFKSRISDAKAFGYLDELSGYQRQEGAVIYQSSEVLPLGKTDWAIPVTYI